MKQECKVDTLNTCIREFQRQARSNRLELELDGVNCGYEESRREQARLSREYGETRSEGEYGETRCAVFKQNLRLRRHQAINNPAIVGGILESSSTWPASLTALLGEAWTETKSGLTLVLCNPSVHLPLSKPR